MNEYLLSDEIIVSDEDFEERKYIISKLINMPESLFSKMRHLQPQIGCLNACKICSKIAKTNIAEWNVNRIRNVIAAIKFVASKYRNEKPYIVWDRDEHRSGVVFSYLDNDIGCYRNLYEYIKITYIELGVKIRISTVGFSRHNKYIVEMHKKINRDLVHALAGFRLSFTPYEIGWAKGNDNNSDYSRKDYIEDMAEVLKIYRPYFDFAGAGSRNMCVELRYKPLAICKKVVVINYNGYFVIQTGAYLFVSCRKNIRFKECKIKNPMDHTISLTREPIYFYKYHLDENEDITKIIQLLLLEKNNNNIVEMYMFVNAEGEYYAVNPTITKQGNYGMNIYPKTEKRKRSGYIITERFFLNSLLDYKASLGIGAMELYSNASWSDVENVVSLCEKKAEIYKNDYLEYEKAEYICREIVPMIRAYIIALQKADYLPNVFFDPNFTIDTGIICNMGGAIYEFNGLTQLVNEPLTPTHERNYGRNNSTMTVEQEAWRISCDFGDKILIEKLSLKDTASQEGQVREVYTIDLVKGDGRLSFADLNKNYLIPGQKKKYC